ncbi:MAG: molybdopterin molybdotransferase MoeA [Methanocorpusculum sp.]|nr:molybdopterin molybdotransferase MoeA [Methanocorpusculum sp.]
MMKFKFGIIEGTPRAVAVAGLKAVWKPKPQTEIIPLAESAGRVLAETVYAPYNLPVVRASPWDGYAVRSADFVHGLPDTSGWVEGTDYVQADTGDDFSDAFDAVIPVEDLYFDADGRMCFEEGMDFSEAGRVTPQGSWLKRGEPAVLAGEVITPMRIAALAVCGAVEVSVLRKPVIAFIPTGDELVPAGTFPQRGQMVNAAGPMAAALIRKYGGEPLMFAIVKDDEKSLREVFSAAVATADIVFISGGSSRGGADYTHRIVEEAAAFYVHGMRSVPGYPVALAEVRGKAVVNIPGPVFAASLAADWCLGALTAQWFGIPVPEKPRVSVKLTADCKKPPAFELLVRLKLDKGEAGLLGTPVGKGMSIPAMLESFDALLTVPEGSEGFSAGDTVEAELL